MSVTSLSTASAGPLTDQQASAESSSLPEIFLSILITLLYMDAFKFIVAFSTLGQLLFYAALLGCALLVFGRARKSIRTVRSIIPCVLWLMFYLVWGVLASRDPAGSFNSAVRVMVRNSLFLAIMAMVFSNPTLRTRTITYMVYGAGINLVIAIFQMRSPAITELLTRLLGSGQFWINAERPGGLWLNANQAAFAYILMMVFAYWLPTKYQRIAWAIGLAGIALTASRSGLYMLIIYAGGLLLSAVNLARAAKRIALVVYIILTLSIGGALLWNMQGRVAETSVTEQLTLARALDILEEENQESGQLTRYYLTRYYASLIQEQPWYGYGIFAYFGGELGNSPMIQGQGAHNIYLTVMGELGFVGALFFAALMLYGFYRHNHLNLPKPTRRNINLAWIIYFIVGFVWHNQFASISGLFFLLLLFHMPTVLADEHHNLV